MSIPGTTISQSIVSLTETAPPIERSSSTEAPGRPTSRPARTVAIATHVSVNTYHGTMLHPGSIPHIQRRSTRPRPPQLAESFRGRRQEQSQLAEALTAGRITWIAGANGSGVSALLQQISNSPAAQSMPDGVAYVAGDVEPPMLSDIVQRLFNRFYGSTSPVQVPLPLARAYLSQVRALFVFDRLPLNRVDLLHLAEMLSNSTVLIGSDSLPHSTQPAIELAGLEIDHALALGVRVSSTDTLQPERLALLQRLCVALDGYPLPLLLLARLLRQRPKRLEPLVQALEQPASGDPLLRAIALLLAELEPADRAALAALTAAGGADVAVTALTKISHCPDDELDRALKRLVSLGILEARNQRFALCSLTLRQTLDRLLRPDDERQRAAAFFAATLPLYASDVGWVGRELGNLSSAAHTALARGNMHQLAVIAKGMQPTLVVRGLWGSWQQVIRWADIAARTTNNRALAAWALHERGTRAGLHGDYRTAMACLEAAVRQRQQAGDSAGAAISQHNLTYLRSVLQPPQIIRRSTDRLPTVRAAVPPVATPLIQRHWSPMLVGLVVLALLLVGVGLLFAVEPSVRQNITPTSSSSLSQPLSPPLSHPGNEPAHALPLARPADPHDPAGN